MGPDNGNDDSLNHHIHGQGSLGLQSNKDIKIVSNVDKNSGGTTHEVKNVTLSTDINNPNLLLIDGLQTITLVRNDIYTFQNTENTNHPFKLFNRRW